MTRTNVAQRLALAVTTATPTMPSLRDRHISLHTIRHTTALHLLQSGEPIDGLALWLGHESPTTTDRLRLPVTAGRLRRRQPRAAACLPEDAAAAPAQSGRPAHDDRRRPIHLVVHKLINEREHSLDLENGEAGPLDPSGGGGGEPHEDPQTRRSEISTKSRSLCMGKYSDAEVAGWFPAVIGITASDDRIVPGPRPTRQWLSLPTETSWPC